MLFDMGKYTDIPDKELIKLANGGDKEACMELSIRFREGTLMLAQNFSKAEYWRKQAVDASDYAGEVYFEDGIDGETEYVEYLNDNSVMQNDNNNWAITPNKDKHEYVIGIDFGHGETSAAFCPIGWGLDPGELEVVKDIDFGSNRKVIPSAINIQANDDAFIGDSAFSPERLKKADVEVCFKQKPTDINGEKEKLMIRYMHEVYSLIKEKNAALFNDNNHLVYIATPSGWDQKTKNLYGQMAAKAGLPIAGVTSESRAAFVKAQQDVSSGLPQYIDQGAIVFDMGSSTLDFTYLRGGQQPIDFGYDCGASRVEKIIYANVRNNNDDIKQFEKQYPNLVAKLLFEARCAKENVYFDPSVRYKKTINFEDIIDDEDFEDSKMKFVFQPGDLDHMLEKEFYIDEIRKAMCDFKNNHINGNPIKVAFLTGGASRMDFIPQLIEECWHLPKDLIYRDQDPSLTISEGVAEVARADIRSGGKGNTKMLFDDLMKDSDVYAPFIELLCEKVYEEITSTVGASVTVFRDNDSDCSINDLQAYIKNNIGNDISQIPEWAMECYKEVFEQKTKEIQEKANKIVSNYSRKSVRMGSANVAISTMPDIDMSSIVAQMKTFGAEFMESSNAIIASIGGAAVGGAIAMLLGGPLAWLIGGGVFLANLFLGEEETEGQKRRKALAKDLNKEQRGKVFDSFSQNWDDICSKIKDSVDKSLRENTSLKQKIQEQSRSTIENYVKECITQTRMLVE